MRRYQIFDTGPRFSRFWMVFLTQTLTQKWDFLTWGSSIDLAQLYVLRFHICRDDPRHPHSSLSTAFQQQGVNADEAPIILRDLSKIFESNPVIRPEYFEFSLTYYNEKFCVLFRKKPF
jgi:hypothetical protein